MKNNQIKKIVLLLIQIIALLTSFVCIYYNNSVWLWVSLLVVNTASNKFQIIELEEKVEYLESKVL